jgi:signal transduction histidine kinase
LLPTWKGNLIIFGLLIVIILGYFFWQVRHMQQSFADRVRGDFEMLAGAIKLNAHHTVLSQETIEEIMQTFMGNAARFVDYLDMVQPFAPDELAAFAKEAGLAGIRIIHGTGENTEGPPGWFPDGSNTVSCPADEEGKTAFDHLPESHLYFMSWPRPDEPGCIVVGLSAVHIEELHEQVGLPYLLKTLSDMGGIVYARIEPNPGDMNQFPSRPEIKLIDNQVAETRLLMEKNILVVGMDAKHLYDHVRQLWYEFFMFSSILAVLGVFFSWLLYRYQTAYLNRVRDFERELARQREDAALGRTTASITHEIRNPLNAISMGLQRLQIEADDLSDEYQELITAMLKAVQRTNGIVENIRQYAKPLEPLSQRVHLEQVVSHILNLYRQKYEAQEIEVKFDVSHGDISVNGDLHMLEEVAENLIKNAIEAQPRGGYLHISLDRKHTEAVLSFENSRFELPPEEAERILDPYFTTKTRGTGLGLAITKKIIYAHKGRLAVEVPSAGLLRMVVRMPLSD